MNAHQLLDPIGNAIGALCLFSGIVGSTFAWHYMPAAAVRPLLDGVAIGSRGGPRGPRCGLSGDQS